MNRKPPFHKRRPRPGPHSGQAESRPADGGGRPFVPRVSKELKPVLKEIGIPDQTPFKPDPFQLEALEKLEKGDVMVAAPTGSGKTYIAVEAMAKLLAQGKRTWYASPLKALSNSKYLEFGAKFGQDNVGLLTGDHKVNPDAPIIVGTTEILRNQLYDAMSRGESLAADLVVMDEAHYLGDPERGVVWEEAIIYMRARVRMLFLSATVANAREIADWLTFIRRRKAEAVLAFERPVPLYPLFLFPDGELTSLTRDGDLNPRIRQYLRQGSERGRGRGRPSGQPPYSRIMEVLDQTNLLPAIFFLKSRSDCDQAISLVAAHTSYMSQERHQRLNVRLDELLEKYPFLKTHKQIRYIRRFGLAAHHAGHLPHWKLLVEQLMQDGLLAAIFSTSTVAAGVNFPARTVVISQSDRFNGREFVDLRATELLQMTGRAGRRGMDRIGFALVVPGPFQNPYLINSLFQADPDPVLSQISINFSMVLNLLLSHRPEQVRTMLDLSLAAFQQGGSRKARQITRLMEELAELLDEGDCRDVEHALVLSREARRIKDAARRLARSRPRVAWEAALEEGLVPGRIFEVHGGQRFVAFERADRRGRDGLMAAKLEEDLGLKKGRVRLKWVQPGRIAALMDTVLDVGPDTEPREALAAIHRAVRAEHDILDLGRFLSERKDTLLDDLDRRLKLLDAELNRLPCGACPIALECHEDQDSRAGDLLEELLAIEGETKASGQLLWASFLRHLEFLKAEGFVDEKDELTDDGLWASQLRLDHPLLFAAGIRAQAWPENDPALLAAVVAPFVVDRELEPFEPGSFLPRLAAAWLRIETTIAPLADRMAAQGFAVPFLNPRPALAILSWAADGDWDQAVRLYGQDPGDMAMLVFRTADHLRQLAGLKETHPTLAPTAREAVAMILKEPVIFPIG
jgi:superfamily II RNA helicase